MVEGVSVPSLICMVLGDSLQILDSFVADYVALLVLEMDARSGAKGH